MRPSSTQVQKVSDVGVASSFASALPEQHALLRFLLNVPEAPTDLLPNVALPLESNMDVMGGSEFSQTLC